MATPKLYGRDDTIRHIIDALEKSLSPVSLIHGFSGMGKTATVVRIEDILSGEYGYIVTNHTVQSSLQSYEEPFIHLLREILQTIPERSISLKDFHKAVSKNPENRLVRILSGLAIDMAKKAGLDETLKVGGDIFTEAVDSLVNEARKIAEEDRASFYTTYTEALNSIAPLCSTVHLLIIDQFEKASEPLITFLTTFPGNKPDYLKILLTINDEIEEGINCLEQLRPMYQYLGVEPISIAGILKDDLREWIKEDNGSTIPDEVLNKAISELNGRPLLLRAWIDNEDFTLESFDHLTDKTYGFYDKLFDRLNTESKQVAVLLSCIPLSLCLSIDIISRIAGKTDLELIPILSDLCKYNFLIKEGTTYRYSHQLVQNFVKEYKSTLTNAHLLEILSILENQYGKVTVYSSPTELVQAKLALTISIEDEDTFTFYKQIAQKQLDEGAYQSAITIVDAAMLKIGELSLSEDAKINMLLIKCKALEQIGEYDAAKAALDGYDLPKLSDITQADAYRILAEINLRLNLYAESLENIHTAEALFDSLGDNNGLARLLIIKGHVLRDMEQYEEAEKLAERLSTDILPGITDEAVKAHIYRSISRAQASLFMKDAIESAVISKSIAEELGLRRHIGSAEFTSGEAYRLNKEYIKAQAAYKAGLEIANSLGNRDLEIYCKLGLTATMFSMNALDSDDIYLNELEKLEPTKFPVESLHSNLLKYIYNLLQGRETTIAEIEEIAAIYEGRFSRSIPGKYLRQLSDEELRQRVKFVADNPIRL